MENILFEKIQILNEKFELQYMPEKDKVKKIFFILCFFEFYNPDVIKNSLIQYYEIFYNEDINNDFINEV